MDSARSRIDKHREFDSAENVEGKWIKAYCDYFKCSADYLFGYIDMPTHQETDIEKVTGLSKVAINRLEQYQSNKNEQCLFVINEILSKNRELLNSITDYIFFPDDIETDYHLETKTGKLSPKDEYFIPIKGTTMSIGVPIHNIPLSPDLLRNALLNNIQENLILFKKGYTIGKIIDNKQNVIINTPDTN